MNNINHYKKHQFEEYIDINSLSTPVYCSNKILKDGKTRIIYYEWDETHNILVELFTKKTQINKETSSEIKDKADKFKTLGVKCFPGNVLKRIYGEDKKISHFIVEVGFDYDKTPETHRWKYWKIPFGYTRRINHITNPFMG